MNHLGLFEGIGGFSLAARWAGWETVAWCEWNEFCQKVLSYHFPKAIGHGDITTTDFTGYAGKIDILTGGFPCQPYSLAGKRLGKEDDRHLWPEMLRAIREIKPTWVVGENVFGIVNWNGGLVFDEVQSDLEAQGYEVQAFVLPAAAVGAPHRRERVWFVAHSDKRAKESSGEGREIESNGRKNNDEQISRRKQAEQHIGRSDVLWDASNPECIGQSRQRRAKGQERTTENKDWEASWSYPNDRWPLESPICSRNDGVSYRLDGIAISKWRSESIKAYGNAIVPQVAYQIFKAINQQP